MRLANDILPADRRLESLIPVVAELCRRHQLACWVKHNINLLITETYRSQDRQCLLWAQGRPVADLPAAVRAVVARYAPEWLELEICPGPVVTWTLASKHTSRRAFDVVPMRDGKCIWSEKDPAWEQIGAEGEALGLEWGGSWPEGQKDRPHFQLTLKEG
ncbi:M15 family peptidase [bacterium]|nr:MAG: M15 family peptidase [bacterium]